MGNTLVRGQVGMVTGQKSQSRFWKGCVVRRSAMVKKKKAVPMRRVVPRLGRTVEREGLSVMRTKHEVGQHGSDSGKNEVGRKERASSGRSDTNGSRAARSFGDSAVS